MERALITGAAGFAAGHLIEWAKGQGAAVLGLDRTANWSINSPEEQNRVDVDILPWDIADPKGLTEADYRRIVDFQPTVAFHLAALSVPKLCGQTEMTDLAYRVNVLGTRRVIELIERLNGIMSPVRLVLISSSHVYGSSRIKEAPFCSEETPVCCQNGYAQSKYQAETEVLAATQARRIEGLVIRAFQHTGPRQTGELMLPEWLDQIASGANLLRIHSREILLDLTDVRDMVRGYWQTAQQGKSGAVYNLGGGNQVTCGTILETLFALCGKRYPILETKPGEKIAPLSNCRQLQLDNINWIPEILLEQTLRDSLAWRSML